MFQGQIDKSLKVAHRGTLEQAPTSLGRVRKGHFAPHGFITPNSLGADVIDAFWCLHIAFKLFMPNRVASQIDVIGFHHLTVVQHIHLAFGFMHLDHIYGGAVIGLELGVAGGQHQPSKHNQEDTKNMHDLPAFFVFGAF